jgi:8-oxo-dGTP diphosphatase
MDDEQAFLATYDASRYPRPSVAVDVVLLTVAGDEVKTLLVRRKPQPYQGLWALPGTFLGIDESPEEAAARALDAKAGIADVFTEQLYTFGSPSRDPRMRVLSIAYYALVEPARLEAAVQARGDGDLILATLAVDANGHVRSVQAREAAGRPLLLAFDHAAILAAAIERIRGKLDYAPIGFELLPSTFTLLDLRRVHEAILGRTLNKDSFRRTVLLRGLVEPTGTLATGLGHRPAELYRFRRSHTEPHR